ncbi:MAG: ABC transporter permease [Clostridia bacterium]|nr:ABC transporter permease [Clostridia bacterium]
MWEFLVAFIPRAIVNGMPLLFGSTGEILTEKSGNLNLGIPGIMFVGAIAGTTGAFLYEQSVGAANMNAWLGTLIPVLSCLVGSFLMGLLYCFLTVTLRANQNVTGLSLTIFGTGLANFLGGTLIKLAKTDASSASSLTISGSLKYFSAGTDPGWLAYVGIGIAILVSLFLRYTRTGLQLRAVGENPATADAAGINVTRYKYLATIIGSMIAGLGGLYYIMVSSQTWSEPKIDASGWLAIALVIFTTWRPSLSIFASIGFGGLLILGTRLDFATEMKELFELVPYVVTLIVLIIVSLRKKRENQPPQSLGLAYFREER